MTRAIKNKFMQSLKLSLMILLLVSSNQTSSFASIYPFKYQKTLAISEQHFVEVSSQNFYEDKSPNQYNIQIYTREKPKKLITAMTRPMSGHITDVIIEDINDDQVQDIIVMSEDTTNNKNYLMIDLFSFNGKHMTWKQHLPSTLITVNSHLLRHKTPNELPRKTAIISLDKLSLQPSSICIGMEIQTDCSN